MFKACIIGHPRAHPNDGRKEIADALEIPEWATTCGMDDRLEVESRAHERRRRC